MKKLVISKCEVCKHKTLHMVDSAYDPRELKDYLKTCCINHDSADIKVFHEGEFFDTVLAPNILMNSTNQMEASERLSTNFLQQDLFYILSAYFNYNRVTNYLKHNENKFEWSFEFRLPVFNNIYEVAISKYGPIVFVSTIKTLSKDEAVEFNRVLDLFLNFIINDCDEREVGFIKGMLLTSSLNSDIQERIDILKRYFNKSSAFYGTTSSTFTSASTSGTISTGYTPRGPQYYTTTVPTRGRNSYGP